ncbi:hypothetical protein CVS29_12520 [Arthrobacter psychrochitiniphilus]|uniref:Uncharacterized protein n=1 Tax=Arthrobacter psychrochitiniphilus TaxID=291045 RepID=A0A2V3DQM3_9MICC|nr:hypothetical protein CVS29_12520 [Arthrobacter psychrochitiniphilus]
MAEPPALHFGHAGQQSFETSQARFYSEFMSQRADIPAVTAAADFERWPLLLPGPPKRFAQRIGAVLSLG